MPTVSINLCCYNSEPFLRQTLDSIVGQTYKDWELVVIDDGSRDGTGAIVREYAGRGYPIVYHYQENRGLGFSRNEALARSTGRYIAFIDHDDLWLPEKLAKQIARFEADAAVDLVYTNYYVVRGTKKTLKFRAAQPEGRAFVSFLGNYPVHVSTAVVRRAALDKLGHYFDPQLNMTEDFELFMRVAWNGLTAYIDEPLATYNYHPGMSSVKQEVRLINESIAVLGSFRRLEAATGERYGAVLDKMIARNRTGLAFKLAKDELAKGNVAAARGLIGPHRRAGRNIFLFYLLTCLPGGVGGRLWPLVLKLKNMVAF